jgi:hypothetical protein
MAFARRWGPLRVSQVLDPRLSVDRFHGTWTPRRMLGSTPLPFPPSDSRRTSWADTQSGNPGKEPTSRGELWIGRELVLVWWLIREHPSHELQCLRVVACRYPCRYNAWNNPLPYYVGIDLDKPDGALPEAPDALPLNVFVVPAPNYLDIVVVNVEPNDTLFSIFPREPPFPRRRWAQKHYEGVQELNTGGKMMAGAGVSPMALPPFVRE